MEGLSSAMSSQAGPSHGHRAGMAASYPDPLGPASWGVPCLRPSSDIEPLHMSDGGDLLGVPRVQETLPGIVGHRNCATGAPLPYVGLH